MTGNRIAPAARPRRLRLPSPAMVVACLSLVLALGGTGYAAGLLPVGSVGTPQLKVDAVVSSKVKDGSLLARDFKADQLPAGPRGAAGAAGPAGERGAAGPQGRAWTARSGGKDSRSCPRCLLHTRHSRSTWRSTGTGDCRARGRSSAHHGDLACRIGDLAGANADRPPRPRGVVSRGVVGFGGRYRRLGWESLPCRRHRVRPSGRSGGRRLARNESVAVGAVVGRAAAAAR